MKKGIKVVSLMVILCMIFSIGLIGCGSKAAESTETSTVTAATVEETPATSVPKVKDVTIRFGFWGSEEELKIQQENAANSEVAYPGLKIELVKYPDDKTFWQQLPAQIAAKTAPDLIQLTNEGHIEYITKGSFAALDDSIKEAGIDTSVYADSAKSIWTVDGKLYGIPTGAAPAMFFVNKDMWNAAGLKDYPKTFDDVKVAAKALTKDKVTGLILNIDAFHLTNYALAFGGGWGNGKTINSDANVKAMEFVVGMFADKLAITPKQVGLGWDGEVFANKKGAMSTGGYWYKGFLKNSGPDIKYDVIPVPQGTVQACTMHSVGLAVLKDAPDKVAAVKAAAYLSREEALTKLMDGVGLNPALTSLSTKYYTANPEFKAIEAMVPFAKDFGYPAEGKKFIDALVSNFEKKVLNNDSRSVKQILDDLQAMFNK